MSTTFGKNLHWLILSFLFINSLGQLGFAEDNKAIFTVCYDEDCVLSAFSTHSKPNNEKLFFFAVTFSSVSDGYCRLYLGWLFELFEYVDFYFVMYDVSNYLRAGILFTTIIRLLSFFNWITFLFFAYFALGFSDEIASSSMFYWVSFITLIVLCKPSDTFSDLCSSTLPSIYYYLYLLVYSNLFIVIFISIRWQWLHFKMSWNFS